MKNAAADFAQPGRKNVTQPQDTTELSHALVLHHLESFRLNDIIELMSDYTEESVFITQQKTYSGIAEIRAFFMELVQHFPTRDSNFVLDQIEAKNQLVFIVWHGQTPTLYVPFGSDTFIITDGKIKHQTFVGELNFIK